MGRNLSNLFISQSYQFITQISGSELQDGLGNTITGSLLITSSRADNATSASQAISASYSNVATSASYALVSTSSSFAINANNAVSASVATSASFATTASFALNAGTTVSTSSLLVTASAVSNVITFTKGDGSTFPVVVATGSATTVNTGSLLITASINDATTTYTKGDGSTFALTVNNVVNANSASLAANATSASFATTAISSSFATNANTATSASYAVSASQAQNAVTASFVASVVSASYALSASQAANATTASFASNIANGLSPTFANVTASNVLITGTASVALLYTQTVSSSVIYSSGSNQFGDASNDVQTLYGTFNVINGPSNFTGSVNSVNGYTGSLLGTASFADNATSASIAVSASQAISSSFATTASFYGGTVISASYAVSASVAVTAATASFANSGFKVGELTISTPGGTNNDNTFVGRDAGFKISSDKNSTLIGSNAGYNLVGDDNVAVGLNALFGQIGSDSTGGQNTAVGTNAGLQIKLGNGNVALGANAMYTGADFPAGADASFNTVVGNSAAKKLYYGDNNTVIGSLTAQSINTGSNNTIIGANYSGSDFSNTVVLTDGQGNVQFYATGGLATLTNITASSINANFTGSLLGTASFALNVTPINTGSFATTGSNTFTGNQTINASASADYWLVDTKPFAQLSTSTIIAGRIDGADEDFVLAGRNFNGTIPSITMTDGVFIYNEGQHQFTGSVAFDDAVTVNDAVVISGSLNVSGSIGASNIIQNNTDTFTGSAKIYEIVTCTQAEYNTVSGSANAANTLYVISDSTGGGQFVSGSLTSNVNALTITSQTASLDCSLANFFTLTLVSGSTTHVSASNLSAGQTINLRVTQASSATGSISFTSNIKQVSGSAYVPTAVTSSVDIVTFIAFDTTNLYLSNIKNFV
jgi:hypothetical protein